MNIETQSPKCASTQEVARAWETGEDIFGELVACEHSQCFVAFWSQTGYDNEPKSGPARQYCSKVCRSKSRDEKEKQGRFEVKELKVHVVNVAFAYLNRDRYIGFDGRYEGPLNQPITIVAKIRKDHGYHPMPRNVHIEPVAAKFHTVTPEDVDWATKQKSFGHTQSMPRPFNTFCTVCVEMVIDKSERSVRVTKGVYLPVEHKCGSVRVYDLRGNLLETKSL